MASSLFVLGGARSGKSRYAVASQPPRRLVTFVATAEARDADMAARIVRHQAERPSSWRTVDAPHDVLTALHEAVRSSQGVVVDCLTVWVSNLMARGDSEELILKAGDDLAAFVLSCAVDLTLVSNEVGEGVHPPTEEGRRFADLLGGVNQRVAAVCDRVVLMVAGLPLTVKEPPRNALGDSVQSA